MSKSKVEYRMGVGYTSMLMIFIVLAITTLSILTFSSARTDLAMSQRSAKMTQAYYEGVGQVQTLLSEIDGQLYTLQSQALAATDGDESEAWPYYLHSLDRLTFTGVDIQVDVNAQTVYFSADAGYERSIDVMLKIMPLDETPRYELISHTLANNSEWEADSGLELFTGGTSEENTNTGAGSNDADDLIMLD